MFPPLHQWPKLTKSTVTPTRCSPGPLFIPTPFHLKPPGLSPSSSTWNQPSRTLFSILFTRYRAFTRPFIFTLTFICALPPQAANSVFRPSLTNPFPRAQSAFITTPFDTQIYEKSWAFQTPRQQSSPVHICRALLRRKANKYSKAPILNYRHHVRSLRARAPEQRSSG